LACFLNPVIPFQMPEIIMESIHPTHSGDALVLRHGDGVDTLNNILDVKNKQIKNLLPPEDALDAVPKGVTDALDNRADQISNRSDKNSLKILDLSIQTTYLMDRKETGSDLLLEPFFNEVKTADFENSINKPAEILDETDFNNNWKRRDGDPDYKNGFLRPRKQKFMLEVLDTFAIEGVGLPFKGGISQYDATNDCYWWMTAETGSNVIGQIIKLSSNMIEGQVQVLATYYLNAIGIANTSWRGIESDGTNLYLVMFENSGSNSEIIGVKINADGTLGEPGFTFGSGETLGATHTILKDDVAFAVYVDSGAITDVLEFDANHIMFMFNVAGGERTLKALDKTTLSIAGATVNDITGLEKFIGGTNLASRPCTKFGNTIYIRMNDSADDARFIFKIDVSNDGTDYTGDLAGKVLKAGGAGGSLIRISGRFPIFQPFDNDGEGGITISKEGQILEVQTGAIAGNGKQLVLRALKNAKFAENQIVREVSMKSFDNVNFPNSLLACMVEKTGNTFYWSADETGTTDTADVFRYNIDDGTFKHVRIIGGVWETVIDFATDGTTIWIIGFDGINKFDVRFGSLSTLVAAMGDSFDIGANTFDITTFTQASGIGATNTNVLHAIGYNSDDDILYLNNTTDLKIDTLSVDGVTWTQGVIDLPLIIAGSQAGGVAYKNGKIYWGQAVSSTFPSRIYVIDVARSTSALQYRIHVYQDPSPIFFADGRFNIDFDGDDLVTANRVFNHFHVFKTLEDPNVLQLMTHLDSSNVLNSNAVRQVTPVVERFFAPEDFADPRDVPDKQYCVVGYDVVAPNGGISILHLDEFFSDKTSAGLDRYDVRKIRVQHYNNDGGLDLVDGNGLIHALFVERDIIYLAGDNIVFIAIDLKAGTATFFAIAASNLSGKTYNGTLSERNDALDRKGVDNPELDTTSALIERIFARTFTKEDSSDYQEDNPKTFVLIGCNGGADLLVINWDNNDNRTFVKVWNTIFDVADDKHGLWIAPSGFVFTGRASTGGEINISDVPAWEIGSDTVSKTQVIAVNAAVFDIAPNSRAWKLPSGEWRHQLLIGTHDVSAASGFDYQLSLVDVENQTQEDIHRANTGTSDVDDGFTAVDLWEDRIYAILSADIDGAELASQAFIYRKQRFNNKQSTIIKNNWFAPIAGNERFNEFGRPIFLQWASGLASTKTRVCRYSPLVNLLTIASTNTGIQFLHFQHADQNIHQSKILDLSQNPSRYHYLQNAILSSGEKTNVILKTDSDITFTNGTTATWQNLTAGTPPAEITRDGVTEGFLKFENITNSKRVGINFVKDDNSGGAKIIVFRTDNSVADTGDTTSASAVVTNLTDTNLFTVGQLVEGAGIPSFTKIQSIDSAIQVTLDTDATATASGVSLTFYDIQKEYTEINLFHAEVDIDDDFVLWIELISAETYTVRVEHSALDNAGDDDFLRIRQFYLVEALADAKVDISIRLTHTDHPGYNENYIVGGINITEVTDKTTILTADGVDTIFELTLDADRAFFPLQFGTRTTVEISAGDPINFLEIFDPSLTWGSNGPSDFDNETVDSEGHLGVKFSIAPATGEVYLKFTPKANKAEIITTMKQATDGISFIDFKPNVRLLDHAIELLK